MPLKRHPILIPLSREHQKGLFLANYIRTGAPRYPGLPEDLAGKLAYLRQQYEGLLKHHFQRDREVTHERLPERHVVLSAFRRDLKKQAWEVEARIQEILGATSWPDAHMQERLDELSRLLHDHIRFEERTYFENLQSIYTESEMMLLEEALEKWNQDNGVSWVGGK